MNQTYLWETHLHTAETSRCGHVPAAEMIAACKVAGYHGVVVTDHFVNGNNNAPPNAPWQDRIDIMVRGYKAAKETGDALGLVVLCGCEFPFEGGDFLAYGVGEAFFRDQPDLGDLSVDAFVRRVHDAGGFVSQAHPFRAAWYLPEKVAKRSDIVDAMEVFNGSHTEEEREWDHKALTLAQQFGLLQTAGSDAHHLHDIGTAGIAFDEPFDTEAGFLSALRAGLARIVRNRK